MEPKEITTKLKMDKCIKRLGETLTFIKLKLKDHKDKFKKKPGA